MSNDIETQLMASMSERVAGVAVTTDFVAGARRRHRRRLATRRIAYTTAIVSLAGTITAVVATGGVAPTPGPSRPAASDQLSPALRLAAAITASENISYRIKATISSSKGPGVPSSALSNAPARTYEGAYDPKANTGYLLSPEGTQSRLINGTLYLEANEGSWPKTMQPVPGLPIPGLPIPGLQLLSDQRITADGRDLLQILKQAKAAVTQNSDGTFHFTQQRQDPPITVEGDVALDAQSRIARLAYDATVVRGPASVHVAIILEFSDYGLPVEVEDPTK